MGCCNSKDTKNKTAKPKEAPKPAPKAAPKAEVPREVAPQKEKEPNPREERISAIQKAAEESPYRYDCCTVEGGEVKACFAEGLVFRIIKGDSWYFYNDTLDYEAHIDYRFGPGSSISAGERTTLEETEDGWTCAHAVVYPLETIHYISGSYNGYKSGITVKPLGDDYYQQAGEEANKTVARELDAVLRLADGETNEEDILRLCVATNTPYVDVNYPPTSEALYRARKDGRMIPPMAMMRPTQYLPSEMRRQVDDVRGAVVAESIDPGHLGDSWLMCAAAILAEEGGMVRNIFAHDNRAEKKVGAHRVLVNKNGWWHSVIVDDYLPTVNKMPVFARSIDDPREVWVAMLQKAYAKLHGSYAAITGGDALQAITDFTGSPTYRFDRQWEAAASNNAAAESFLHQLVELSRVGSTLVVCTPSYSSESYLGHQRRQNEQAWRAKYAKAGLRLGYTYFVDRVVTAKKYNVVLLKIRNPWRCSETWTGPWSYGSAEWQRFSDAASICLEDSKADNSSFWMEWNDAKNYFDGGGVIFSEENTTDYRVKGAYEDTTPNVVLQVTVTKPVTVRLTLSQEDKRGIVPPNAACRYAPVMLTISRQDGQVQRVQRNSSWDPSQPTQDYDFLVSRDIAMTYTFEPGARYHVVPRIHRKGVVDGFSRPYVLGIIASTPLDDVATIEAKHIDAESRVFKNLITYPAGELPSVVVEHQVRSTGKDPQTKMSAAIVGTPVAAPPPAAKVSPSVSSRASNSAEAVSQEEGEVAAAEGSSPNSIVLTSVQEAEHHADDEPVVEVQAATPVADDQPPQEGRNSPDEL